MTITYIPATGFASRLIVISDNATPASGTYAWGLLCEDAKPKMSWALSALIKIANFFGITISRKGFKLDIVWALNTSIDNYADYESLLKAIGYWEKNNTKLYLSIKNSWNSNLAVNPTYAAPTTLTQTEGHLSNLDVDVLANEVKIKVKFYQFTKS